MARATRALAAAALLALPVLATVLLPADLRVDFLPSPDAITVSAAPELSWIPTDASASGARGLAQVSYQVQVSSDAAFSAPFYDSGPVHSNATKIAVPSIAGQAPDSALVWRVRVGGTDDGTLSPWVTAAFLRGLGSADFSAQWVAPAVTRAATAPVRFRAVVPAVPADVVRATAYVASPAYWHLFSGGAQLDAGAEMGPYTVFEARVLYSAINVTELVRSAAGGPVVLGARLAPGPYGWPKFGFAYTGAPLLLELRVARADGSTAVFASGTPSLALSAHADPITWYSWYGGEVVDARLEEPLDGWDSPAYNETGRGWEAVRPFAGVGAAAELTPHDFGRIVRVAEFAPVARSSPAPGEFTLSFAQVRSGGEGRRSLVCVASHRSLSVPELRRLRRGRRPGCRRRGNDGDAQRRRAPLAGRPRLQPAQRVDEHEPRVDAARGRGRRDDPAGLRLLGLPARPGQAAASSPALPHPAAAPHAEPPLPRRCPRRRSPAGPRAPRRPTPAASAASPSRRSTTRTSPGASRPLEGSHRRQRSLRAFGTPPRVSLRRSASRAPHPRPQGSSSSWVGC